MLNYELTFLCRNAVVIGLLSCCKGVVEVVINSIYIGEACKTRVGWQLACEPSVASDSDTVAGECRAVIDLAAVTASECNVSAYNMHIVSTLLYLVVGMKSLYIHMLGAFGHMSHVG